MKMFYATKCVHNKPSFQIVSINSGAAEGTYAMSNKLINKSLGLDVLYYEQNIGQNSTYRPADANG